MTSTIQRLAIPALVAISMLATGCRTNLLPEYADRIDTAHVVSVTPDGPQFSLGGSSSGNMLALATNVASLGIGVELSRKFAEGTTPEEIEAQMSEVFKSELDRSFDWTLAADAKAEHDTRIEVRIVSYGLFADSQMSPVKYRMSIDARMVYRPQSKLIWEYSTTYEEPLTPVDLRVAGDGQPGSDVNQAVGAINTGINLGLLSKLSPEELRMVFMGLARKSGARLVQQIREDIAD